LLRLLCGGTYDRNRSIRLLLNNGINRRDRALRLLLGFLQPLADALDLPSLGVHLRLKLILRELQLATDVLKLNDELLHLLGARIEAYVAQGLLSLNPLLLLLPLDLLLKLLIAHLLTIDWLLYLIVHFDTSC
jgi:hypothetical protein